MSANYDSSLLRRRSPSEPLHLPHLPALDPAVLLLTYRSGRRPSTYQPRPIVEHSWPYQTTQPKGVLSPWDTPMLTMPLLRTNDFTPAADLRSFPPPRLHTYTTREDRKLTNEAPRLATRRQALLVTASSHSRSKPHCLKAYPIGYTRVMSGPQLSKSSTASISVLQ
jgi:hypothetical protein